jgi:hypothetical protein
MPRHPCHSREQASECNNADRGAYMDLSAEKVCLWIRSQIYFVDYHTTGEKAEELEQACALIEKHL